jgi:uncharacterized protein YjaZ
MKKIFHFATNTLVVFILLFLTACGDNKLDINTSDIEVELDIKHFEHDLFASEMNDIGVFQDKYPYFISDYTRGILGFQGSDEEAFQQLMLFKTDVNAKKMYEHVNTKFGDFKPYKEQLTDAYKRFKYFFPQLQIPTIVTYTSNFSFYINPVGQDYIGIALDMHMGADFKPYEYTNIENYWKKTLIPESIVTHHMMAHANDLFANTNKGGNFIDEMIYYGKLLYFLDATCAKTEDHVKIGLTKEELEWCKLEEKNIWAFIVKEKYLYDTDRRSFERLIKEGPKTIASGVPPEAPAMIGRFVGWQIVRKYMNEKDVLDLKALMLETDAQKILNTSGYKP